MHVRRSLSYDDAGILYLDEWDVADNSAEERFVREGVRSTALGHINNPRTGFKVPECLHRIYDARVVQWADETAARLREGKAVPR